MRKRVIILCILLTTVALGITSLISISAVEQDYLKEARTFLQSAMNLAMSYPVAGGDYDAAAHQTAQSMGNNTRITFVALDGTVLGDSEGDKNTMPSHADRPEVADALKSGQGEAIRYSSTVSKDMLYIARKYGDTIARFAMPLGNKQVFIDNILPSVIMAGIAALIVVFISINFLMKQILKPFRNFQLAFGRILDGGAVEMPAAAYPELVPVVEGMNKMAQRLNEHIASVKQQTEKIDNIIRHMQEGLVLLDEHAYVLLSNDAARCLLDVDADLNEKNFLHLVRNKEILEAVKAAIDDRKPTVLDWGKRHGRVLRILISPVQQSEGAIMMISDVTEIRQAENMRRDFTANVSHELKTPLTTIRGFAELMAEGMVKDAQTQHKYAMLIKIETERLINLINDILRISELEDTAIPVNLEDVDVLETACEAVELLQAEAQKRGVQLSVRGESLKIQASKDRIKELILNLLDNAIKYNRDNGKVEINISKKEGRASIVVEDTGIGIPEMHRERVFERFYRVDKGRSKKTGGTGLGLSIVKHIAGLYKGQIFLQSEPGEGSRFEVLLPFTQSR